MKIKFILTPFILLIISLLSSCADDVLSDNNAGNQANEIETRTVANQFSMKLNKDIASDIDNHKSTLTYPTGNAKLDAYMDGIGAKFIKRVFPYSGKYESRLVSNELNLWYTVMIDKNAIHKKAATEDYKSVATIVEPVKFPAHEEPETHAVELPAAKTRAWTEPFNDPYAAYQWNLKNNGNIGNTETTISSIKGADINAVNAWKINTGNSDVTVSVIDGGVDISHEDLKDNIWINKGEIPGNGIDDDDNGYIDDVNGYNFVDDTGVIEATDHATHVAGIVAARNNNGKGVCGIAGGDGTDGSGARIMSCQIFKNNPDYDPKDPNSSDAIAADSNYIAAAIVYAANNGGNIGQCSWGYPYEEPAVIHEAIKYFNEYAGNYSGSPMKGGLMFFSAGNDGLHTNNYPAADDDVISVSAYAPDLLPTWYTDYNYTVDICAPGGTSPTNGKYPEVNGKYAMEVLSCYSSKDGKSRYGYMQGTSMACPHLSGIAALIVSQYGGNGFTNKELRRRVLAGIKPVDINANVDEKYKDNLGLGFADAYEALQDFDLSVEPSAPYFIKEKTETSYHEITLRFATDKVADGALQFFTLYYSDQPINTANYKKAKYANIAANTVDSKEELSRTFTKLDAGKKYYFALTATAKSGKESPLVVYEGGCSTVVNHAPEIAPQIDTSRPIEVAGNDELIIPFKIIDPDGHGMYYDISNTYATKAEVGENGLNITFYAEKLPIGTSEITLTITDKYGAKASTKVTIRKIRDYAPAYNKKGINIKKGNTTEIDLRDYFDDENINTVSFSAEGGNGNFSYQQKDNILTVIGKKIGSGEIKVTATDKHKQTTEVNIPVIIFADDFVYSVYPTIATTTIYAKFGSRPQGRITVKIIDANGREALNRSYAFQDMDADKLILPISISKLARGKYKVEVAADGKSFSTQIIKK